MHQNLDVVTGTSLTSKVVKYTCSMIKMFTYRVDSGTWEFDGVEVASMVSTNGTTVITCLSMHLTSFAVLVNAADGTSDVSRVL